MTLLLLVGFSAATAFSQNEVVKKDDFARSVAKAISTKKLIMDRITEVNGLQIFPAYYDGKALCGSSNSYLFYK